MLTPKYSTQLNPYYLCRMPRSKALKKSDGRQLAIITALTLALLGGFGYALEHLQAPAAADVAVWRPWVGDGFTE